MNPILELKQKRTAAITAASQVLDKASAEKRALTVEEQQAYDRAFAEARDLKATIERMEQQGLLEKETSDATEQRDKARRDNPESDDVKRQKAFEMLLRHGRQGVPEELRSFLYTGSQNSADFDYQKRSQSAITGNLGGYTVPEGFMAEIVEAKKYFGGMFEAGCDLVNTAAGNDLPWPTSDDTSNVGAILPENSPESVLDVAFDVVVLHAYKYSSRMLKVPIELLQDSGVAIEPFFKRKLAERLGRIQNTHFTTGTGTNQPQGVVVGSTAGATSASPTALVYTELIDLKYSVNRAYRRNARWMMNDTTLAAILKLEDEQGRPLILDYARTLQMGEPEQLLGQPLIINDDMAAIAASAKVILYGEFFNYKIRRVMAMLMLRLVERFAEYGQVAFLAFERVDGRMVDAGTHPIKHLIMHS